MKKFIIIALWLVTSQGYGQQVPDVDIKDNLKSETFITSYLMQIYQMGQEDLESTLLEAAERNMPVRGSDLYVEFVRGSATDIEMSIDEEVVRNLPHTEHTTTYKNRASAWVNLDKLFEVASQLPQDYQMNEVVVEVEDNQGPGVTNSDSYASSAGNGLTLAIIDSGFDMLTEARNAGAAPTSGNTTAYNYTGSGIESGTRHGTGCLETVFDHAPNADYVICKINSLSDMGDAVDDCISENVDIISHSLSRYNTGWGNGSGAACAAAQDATANGILFFTSAGNRNGTHWQGSFSDSDNDDWHQFSGADEQNNFTMNGTASNNAQVSAYLQWNSSSSTDHYDFYLYDANTNTVLASSTNTNGYEYIFYASATVRSVYLAVRAKTANPPQFEFFNHDAACTDFQYASTTGSTTSPSNSSSSNVISVGAVAWNNFASAQGTTGIVMGYSSRGPTNSGSLKPDLCSPTNTTTVAYGGGFGGTSCATPNAAGTAAAFWSKHSFYSATGVRHILFNKAPLFKDWGTAGNDNSYGRGGIFLMDYHVNNRYIAKSAFNTTSSPTLPLYSMSDADADAASIANKIIYYLNSSEVAPNTNIIDKAMIYDSATGTVID